MKYCIIITDGASDYKVKELGDMTPLEKAEKPNMDRIVRQGRLGLVHTVPAGYDPGSDVAIMSLLGNDPAEYYTGRAPIEAAAQKLKVEPDEWVFRCNLVTIADEKMLDHSGGEIGNEEAQELIQLINDKLAPPNGRFYPGVSYRNLFICRQDFDVKTTPPHNILDREIDPYYPEGKGAELLTEMIKRSRPLLENHPINRHKAAAGGHPANSIWFWGEGTNPRFPSFYERFGLKGGVISAVDLVRGLGELMGWEILPVEGATGYFNTNYKGKGLKAIEAFKELDIICIHVEAPDEAGHSGNPVEKYKAIELIDKHIVGPVAEYLEKQEEGWRLLIMPDHPTPCVLRTHVNEAVPFVLAGKGIEKNGGNAFTEAEALATGLRILQGHTLIETLVR